MRWKAHLFLIGFSLPLVFVFTYLARDWSDQRTAAIGVLCAIPYSLFVGAVLIAVAPPRRKP